MPTELDFNKLRALRERLAAVRAKHRPSLEAYLSKDGKGFAHLITKLDKASVASTATCVMALVVAGHWNGSLAENTAAVAAKLVEKRTSAELVENNPFSLSFMSEGILALQDVVPAYPSRDVHYALVHDDFANHLVCHLNNEEGQLAIKGSISIFPYPPSAYLTQLVHRVLKRLSIGETSLSEDMHRWSRNGNCSPLFMR